jgi:hypothetical protein
MDKAAFAEKRNQTRYTVQENTFAALRNHGFRLGVIKDISRGGLALHYIADGNLLHGSVMIVRLLKEGHSYLQDVPVKIISDLEVGDQPPFSFIPMRRCGIQFKEMTPSRMSQVERFIENYAL